MRLRRRARKPQQVIVNAMDCPGCGRLVLFLFGQSENTCGWCSQVVRLEPVR